MVKLETINEELFYKVIKMKLAPEQDKFVAENLYSLAQTWLYYEDTKPFAIMNDDTPVGFVLLDWQENERTLGVWRIMVDIEHQKKGYGRAALQAIIEMAKAENKFDMIHIDYIEGNDVAKNLYLSIGFKDTGILEGNQHVLKMYLTDTPKVGFSIADEDELEEVIEVFNKEKEIGNPLPESLNSVEKVTAAIEASKLRRFTIMGKTIGFDVNNELVLSGDYLKYLDEIKAVYYC